MNLQKFKIISDKDVQALSETTDTILLNLSHIVSIKPINIMLEQGVVRGYWVRMSNGKKYRAISVPESVSNLIGDIPKTTSEDIE